MARSWRGAIDLLRRALPASLKRTLKRVWDPARVFSVREALLESGRDSASFERWNAATLALAGSGPRASVVVVSYDGLDYTRLCVARLLANSTAETTEIVVVDNGSTDGSAQYLADLTGRLVGISAILNRDNRGFAAAVNQGLSQARGAVLVIMNNDVAVADGWLDRLVRHLDEPAAGLVVPVTNVSANESRIEVEYQDLRSMETFARARMSEFEGERFEIDVAPMYCVAMLRATWERVGPLDEQFEIGLFEDDDYSRRVHDAGLRVACAEDVFVHHFGQASFGKMSSGAYRRLWTANRERFERKWGVEWTPHRRRGE